MALLTPEEAWRIEQARLRYQDQDEDLDLEIGRSERTGFHLDPEVIAAIKVSPASLSQIAEQYGVSKKHAWRLRHTKEIP
jgi:hypothetical protein